MARKQLIGKVVSDKMLKTVVVLLERRVRHPMYRKIITITKKIKADIGALEPKTGQTVKIEQIRPMSRDKQFKVIEIIEIGKKVIKVKSK